MPFLGFDCETRLFAPGYKAPKPVCWTWDSPTQRGKIIHADLAHHTIRAWLTGTDILVGQNVAYDTAVICEHYPDLRDLVFRAYEEDRITCTKIREQLIDTALGRFRGSIEKGEWVQRGYSLFDLARRYLGKTIDKDTWRLRYAELESLPIIQWPAGAIEYAIGDAIDTRTIAEAQEQAKHFLSDQFRQSRAQFALALTSCRGLRTDPEKVEIFARIAEERYGALRKRLQDVGIVRPDRVNRKGETVEGAADTAKAAEFMASACEEEGIQPIRTKGGKIALGADACERVGCPVIGDYSEFLTARKVISNDVSMLRDAVRVCHPSYDITKTGRTTCAKPNIQNLRKMVGIRECFVPDDGYCFIQCDYPSLELYTIAQWCITTFGFSALGDTLNADRDAHLTTAATMLGRTYEDVLAHRGAEDVKNARQASKALNFGLPGGLGAKRLAEYAEATFGVKMEIEEAKHNAKIWKKTYPEMARHLQLAGELTEQEGVGGEVSPFTGQVTAGKTYSEIANERFQRLGADIAKAALYLVARACFIEEDSPLYGSYPVAFVHDEIIVETPIANFRPAAKLLSELMMKAANVYLIHVPMKCTGDVKLESQAMAVWSKDAKPLYNEKGELEIWRPTAGPGCARLTA